MSCEHTWKTTSVWVWRSFVARFSRRMQRQMSNPLSILISQASKLKSILVKGKPPIRQQSVSLLRLKRSRYVPCFCITWRNFTITFEHGRIITWRFPRFSAFDIFFRQSAKTLIFTMFDGFSEFAFWWVVDRNQGQQIQKNPALDEWTKSGTSIIKYGARARAGHNP